jgi:hypothetical protein
VQSRAEHEVALQQGARADEDIENFLLAGVHAE